MTRAVAETGGIITGGAAQVGRLGVTIASRSWTSWRALQQVGALLEDHLNGRQLRDRLRAEVAEPVHAVEHLLERDGDQGLDIGRRQAETGRLDLDLRRRELGKDIDRASSGSTARRRAIIPAASATTRKRNFRLERDDPAHQRRPLGRLLGHSPSTTYSVPSNSAPPTVTTAVPGGGPDAEHGAVAVHVVDDNALPDVGERRRVRVDPAGSVLVVEHCGQRDTVRPAPQGRGADGLHRLDGPARSARRRPSVRVTRPTSLPSIGSTDAGSRLRSARLSRRAAAGERETGENDDQRRANGFDGASQPSLRQAGARTGRSRDGARAGEHRARTAGTARARSAR